MDGRKFADPVAVANDKRALFTAEFQVLGFAADAGHRMDMVFGAESREAFDLGSGVNDCFVADVNTVFDNGERANRHSGTQVRTRMNNRRGVYVCLHQSSLGTTEAVRMPSATTLPSTMALPLVFHIIILCRS